MGGSWKSLIISIKRSHESITNEKTITEELLTTLLCEVEGILTSRPLTSISDDITDSETLTPSYILLGSSQPNIEPGNYENVEVDYRKKWIIIFIIIIISFILIRKRLFLSHIYKNRLFRRLTHMFYKI